MGLYTPNAQVWYPTTADTAEINVLLATLASSIEDGIEPRLAHQEIAVGLRATAPHSSFTIPYHDGSGAADTRGIRIPYQVTATFGDFSQGLTISSGVATVATAGMYFISAGMGTAGANAGHGVKTLLFKGSTLIGVDERVMNDNNNWVNAVATTVVNCVPGDTISARGYVTGAPYTSTLTNSAETTYMSIVLVQALPL